MKYTINPYSQVILNNGKYEFFAPPQKNETTKIELDMDKSTLNYLLSEKGLSKEELINIVGTENTEFLISHKIFLDFLLNDDAVLSRTNQFFRQHLSEEQQKKIKESSILVLGCGGIGSSIAWLLAGLGIKKMTILDFDIVEASNLNRMFMFDTSDIGKKKVAVIKEKIQKIYTGIEIDMIDAKITSEDILSEICLKENYTLIIKALDSPSVFPVWLDSVCKNNNLKYVGGITLRDRVIIGPSYIPNIAEDGWSDIIHMNNSSEHIYGTVPSIGTMLFNATDRIAVEAVKILIGNYDACEFKNCIYSENIFTGEKEVIRSKKSRFKENGIKKANAFLNLSAIVGFGLCSMYNSSLLLLVVILSSVLPFFSYYGKKYILLQTFMNASICSFFLSLYILNSIGFNLLYFCLVLIVVASIVCTVSLLIGSIAIRLFCKFEKVR